MLTHGGANLLQTGPPPYKILHILNKSRLTLNFFKAFSSLYKEHIHINFSGEYITNTKISIFEGDRHINIDLVVKVILMNFISPSHLR